MHSHGRRHTTPGDRGQFARRPEFPDLFGWGWGPGRGPHGRGRGRGPRGGRARRGDIRAAILALLSERPMHGYEMIQELEERTDGIWRPSPGSIYPTLQLLEEQGLIAADGSSGKKRFELTAEGRAELDAAAGSQKPWEEVTEGIDPTHRQLRDSIFGIVMAIKQVAEAGTDGQKAEVVDIMAETRRRLYAILARDE
jgi:DNA-binding PadR family transcriptional regulator